MNNPDYDAAKTFIKKKFIDLKNKIISNFKEGFIKKDIILINVSKFLFRTRFLTVKNTNSWMRSQTTIIRKPLSSHRRCTGLRLSLSNRKSRTCSFSSKEVLITPLPRPSMASKRTSIKSALYYPNIKNISREGSSHSSSKK